MRIAPIIFIMSPGMKGITPVTKASFRDKFATIISQPVPMAYVVKIASIPPLVKPKTLEFLDFLMNFSLIFPAMKAAGMNPMMYPPVGPSSIPGPPDPAWKTGSPIVPRIR